MKNILISSSSEPDRGSGISTYAKEITENLISKGYNIHYLSPTPKDKTWLEKHNITHIVSDRNGCQTETCKRTLEYIITNSIDGIINNDNSVITSIAPAVKCPVISVGHMEKTTIAALAAYNVEWMDYIVAISNDMKQTYTTKYKIPISKCPIVYNGLNTVINSIKIKTDSKLNIIFAGGYLKIKGSDLILKMILTKDPIWSNIEFNWYGDLPKKIIDKIKSHPSINIHGRVPREKLMQKMKEADIFLMASRIEGCPMSMLEAMSYGITPITSNGRGAMPSLIDHGIHGYVCDLEKWPLQALSCITALHKNRNLLKSMKTAVLEHFNKNFIIDKTTDNLINLLSNPTVDRSKPSKEITILKWHRPMNANFFEKVNWRLGILKTEAKLKL